MAARNKGINLVPDDRKTRTNWGFFFDWLLSIGRYIIIFTELAVIIAFVIRFKIDFDLNKLYENIEIKKETVSRQAEFEKEFRTLQEKLLTIQEISKSRFTPQLAIQELEQITPKTVSLTSFSFAGNDVSIEGRAYSSTGLASFAYRLAQSGHFTNTQIGEISRSIRLEIAFSLKTTWQDHEKGLSNGEK